MTEQRTITVTAYRTPDGKPTCATNIYTGKHCRFLAVRKMGLIEWCGATGCDISRNGDHGYTIPVDGCPVWAGVEK
jgi:hypothetical protein